MLEVKLPVDLPALDLSSALPLIALVVLAALILFTLTARSLLQSKGLAIVALAAILIGGSASIVGGLHAIAGLIGVTGLVAIGLIVTLGRQPEVLDMVRTLVDQRTPPSTLTPPPVNGIDQPPSMTYHLPAAGQTATPRRHATRRSARLPKGLGF